MQADYGGKEFCSEGTSIGNAPSHAAINVFQAVGGCPAWSLKQIISSGNYM